MQHLRDGDVIDPAEQIIWLHGMLLAEQASRRENAVVVHTKWVWFALAQPLMAKEGGIASHCKV